MPSSLPSKDWHALFHPHDPALFLSAVRGHERLRLRTDRAAWFSKLLPWSQINQLINLDDLVSGKIRLVRQDRPVPLEMVSSIPRLTNRRTLFPDALQALCQLGASLVFNTIDERIPRIAALTAMIERHLRCRTFTNAYASFRRESAFGAHFDAQNILILQLQGRKRWWCHGPVEDWPMVSRSIARNDLPPVAWEGVLEPGDMLFLPRGDIHRTQVEGEASLHLTITMTPLTGQDVVAWLGREIAASEPLLRQDIPTLDAGENLSARADVLKALLHRHIDALDLSGFLEDADRRCALIRPATLGLDATITRQTWLAPMLRRRIDLPPAAGGEVTLLIDDSAFKLTAAERDVLAVLMEQDGMSIAELEALLPGCDIGLAAAGLARKSLVLPLEDD